MRAPTPLMRSETQKPTPPRGKSPTATRVLAMMQPDKPIRATPAAPMAWLTWPKVVWPRIPETQSGQHSVVNSDRFVLRRARVDDAVRGAAPERIFPSRMDELRTFRQLGSRTAGHPEHDLRWASRRPPGPLGQGLANAVEWRWGRKESRSIGVAVQPAATRRSYDHATWVFVGDGLRGGISTRGRIAGGHLGARELTCLTDENGIFNRRPGRR